MPSNYMVKILFGFFLFIGATELVMAEKVEPEHKVVLSGAGGIFNPFDGKTGFSGLGQLMFQTSPQVRFGGEFELRDYQAELFKVNNVDIQSFILRGIGLFFLRPEGVSPYIGAGIGFSVNNFDENEVEKRRPSIRIKNDIGLGFGVLGLVGVEVPVGDRFAFFVEGRASADFQVTNTEEPGGDETDIENIGGISGLGGIRLRF